MLGIKENTEKTNKQSVAIEKTSICAYSYPSQISKMEQLTAFSHYGLIPNVQTTDLSE